MSFCLGTTKGGRPCKRSPGPAGYCAAHADQAALVPESQEVPSHVLRRILDKATHAVRPSRASAGDQGGRGVRLAISRRGRRPKKAQQHQAGLAHRGSLSAYHTSSRDSRALHADATESLTSYRRWRSTRTY